VTRRPPSPASAPIETEWQFDAIDVRPVERWLAGLSNGAGPAVEPGPASTMVDTYLDTQDWRLFRAGYSLRIRRKGGHVEATLKSLTEGQDGLRRRAEFSETLAGRDAAALLNASGPVGARAKLAAGSTPLMSLFEVRTRRREYRLMIDNAPAGEIAVDRTTIPLGDHSESARLRRVEVEVADSRVLELTPFVESLRSACALQPAGLSKYQAGLLARGLQPAAAPDLGPRDVEPSGSVGEVAFAVLRLHFDALLANEPGTRIGDHIEDLHDMRVATRRLRAALSIFADGLPVRFARFRDEFGWVADALGAVRDLDVQLDQLDAWMAASTDEDAAALAPLHGLLEEQRLDARERMMAALDSVRYERLVAGFTTALRRGPPRTSPVSRQPAFGVAPELIIDRHRKVLKAGGRATRSPSSSAYHRLRIRAKRLRYALEFLSPLYPAEAPPVVKRLVAVQDLLGLLQDADVAIRRLRTLVAQRGLALAPNTIFAMGLVARRYGEQEEELRARFPKAYKRVSGKRWKDLAREMKRRRPAAPPPPVLRPVEPLLAPPLASTTQPTSHAEHSDNPQDAG
jgi:CHAD domain-containing protein